MSSVDDRLTALGAMSAAELKVERGRVLREPPPPIGADLLTRGIAYRLQERMHGGLPSSTKRQLNRLVRQLETNGEIAIYREVVLKVGTRLARDWRGKTHHVLVLDEDFLFEDRRYTWLTKIALAITGANWSGPRFFGLKRRPAAFGAAWDG